MSQSHPPSTSKEAPDVALAAASDRFLMTGQDAVLKGAFEHDRDVALIVGPRSGPFEGLFQRAESESVHRLLRQHGTALKQVGDASRAVALAHRSARSGRNTLALVPADRLHAALPQVTTASSTELPPGTSFVLLMEDGSHHSDPATRAISPIQLVTALEMPAVAPGSMTQLKDYVDFALRLSRSSARPVALIAHGVMFQQAEMVDARPNRGASVADALLARGRRKPRWSEVRDVTRMARRMELNQQRAMPSPGEVVPLGFVTVGPADQTVQFLLGTLNLIGRVPLFQLGLIHPQDHVALGRFLSRCANVIVLEPQPGTVESLVLRVAEQRRRGGEPCAAVWGRHLPPMDGTSPPALTAEDMLHPSLLVRRVLHVLHAVRPQMQISTRLISDPPPLPISTPPRGRNIGFAAAERQLRQMLKDVDQWLRNQNDSADAPAERRALAIDGIAPSTQFDRLVTVETWDASSFITSGIEAVRQAARERQPWLMLVCDFTAPERVNLERLARGGVPDDAVDVTRIESTDVNEPRSLREKLQLAALHNGLTILLVQDAMPRFDLLAQERQLAEIDRSGVEPLRRIVRSTDQVCRFPPWPGEDDDEDHEATPELHRRELKTELSVEHNPKQFGSRVRVYVRPLLEQLDILRTKPPTWIWQRRTGARLDLPTPIHRHARQWRVHLAGVRGRSPGVAAMVLADAGRAMGYDVAWRHDPTSIGAGVRAWTQILFTRGPRSGASLSTISPAIPFGEADLLLGLDAIEVIRAVDPASTLRVAAPNRTYLIANVTALGDDTLSAGDDEPQRLRDRLRETLDGITLDEHRCLDTIAAVCRQWFYTDRVTDMVMLGMAFQRGLIPISVEAIDAAIDIAEASKVGRAREAFSFGRHLAVNEKLLRRSLDQPIEDPHRLIRRTIMSLRGRRFLSRSLADRFTRLIERSLTSMPGLSETGAGRLALRDFIIALYRCVEWGGFDYADRYASLIMALYRHDRGDTGRAMTRDAILPLAEVMLIRDPVYLASMATSVEERRRFRNLHNIKAARGDEVERRYLTRIDLTGFGYRIRADLRSSDWPARLARAARFIVPQRWRGSQRERERRSYLTSLVQRATFHREDEYNDWCEAMHRLHNQVREDRLRDMAMAELRMLAEPRGEGDRSRPSPVT